MIVAQDNPDRQTVLTDDEVPRILDLDIGHDPCSPTHYADRSLIFFSPPRDVLQLTELLCFRGFPLLELSCGREISTNVSPNRDVQEYTRLTVRSTAGQAQFASCIPS